MERRGVLLDKSVSENKGPKYTTSDLNTIKGEDHLGIRSVGISIADRLQSGITSITPRARYWSFFAWVLYDFIENGRVEKTMLNFKQHLKRQEWYFILANIADAEAKHSKTHELIGSTKGIEIWNRNQDPIIPKPDYVKNALGGYGTYRRVMKIAGITAVGDEAEGVYIDRLTQPLGKQLAQAFEANIKHTEYFQEYRFLDEPVPRHVIFQYGQAVNLDRLKEESSKDRSILEDIFLPKEPKNERHSYRKDSMLYYMAIIHQSEGEKLTFNRMQVKMFDDFAQKNLNIPDQLHNVAIGWEIYQARQYFTYSVDTIWSYLLNRMSKRIMKMDELIDTTLTDLVDNFHDLNQHGLHGMATFPLDPYKRNQFITDMRDEAYHVTSHVWQPLIVMMDMYDRMSRRRDFENFHHDLLDLGGRDGISFSTWIRFVDSSSTKSLYNIIGYILRYFILEQHQKVALNKMLTTNNETYHFIENDGYLYFEKNDRPVFNTFRVNQGLSILNDLGYVSKNSGLHHVEPIGLVRLNGSY